MIPTNDQLEELKTEIKKSKSSPIWLLLFAVCLNMAFACGWMAHDIKHKCINTKITYARVPVHIPIKLKGAKYDAVCDDVTFYKVAE